MGLLSAAAELGSLECGCPVRDEGFPANKWFQIGEKGSQN
ncbi:hypothetical protein SLEP1_g28721 [Rubroshorea leprosula]|uniref:Uncharacterized protein n=1 Tax=Rubroshorea leprosula TaxID=152421 RepID=A0AAV5JUJ5_9ROSI|nr:hypothetical protein SLEP1_g28721 [Rubroshorea leprosula]